MTAMGAADGGSADAARRLGRLFPRRAYGRLLTLVLLCILAPLATPDDGPSAALSVVLQAVTVVAAVAITGASRHVARALRIAMGLVVLWGVSIGVVANARPDLEQLAVQIALGVALVLAVVVPVLVARDVASHERITVATAQAGLAVYLLLGLAVAFGHNVIDAVTTGAYSQPLSQSDAIYFSFITITTVGFGDIAPVAGVARSLALASAIFGQLYLVSVVALIIGNLGRQRGPRGPRVTDA